MMLLGIQQLMRNASLHQTITQGPGRSDRLHANQHRLAAPPGGFNFSDQGCHPALAIKMTGKAPFHSTARKSQSDGAHSQPINLHEFRSRFPQRSTHAAKQLVTREKRLIGHLRDGSARRVVRT